MREFKFFQKRKVHGVDVTLLRLYHNRIHQVYLNRYDFSINELNRMNNLYNETRNFIWNSDIVHFDGIREYYRTYVHFILHGNIVENAEDTITDSHHERMTRNSEESMYT
jgi:hypothetical protein